MIGLKHAGCSSAHGVQVNFRQLPRDPNPYPVGPSLECYAAPVEP
jgi:hypothetical protein